MERATKEIERANELLVEVLDIIEGVSKGQLGILQHEKVEELKEVQIKLQDCSTTLAQYN